MRTQWVSVSLQRGGSFLRIYSRARFTMKPNNSYVSLSHSNTTFGFNPSNIIHTLPCPPRLQGRSVPFEI